MKNESELARLADTATDIGEILRAVGLVPDTVKAVLLDAVAERTRYLSNGVHQMTMPEAPEPESKPKRSFGKAKCSVCGKDFERKGPRDVKCTVCKEAKTCTECKEYGGGTECTLRPAITIDDPVKVAGECMTFDRKRKRNGK